MGNWVEYKGGSDCYLEREDYHNSHNQGEQAVLVLGPAKECWEN